MSLRRARSPEKLVEWVRAKFAPSQKKYWKSKFYKHFANRNARPRKTLASTEDDDPCLDEFRVCFKLGVRDKDRKRKIIVNAVRHLERVFSDSAAAADAEASAPDHDVGVLGAAARSNATPPPDGASEERPCKRRSRAPEKLVEWVRAKFAPSHKRQWKSNFQKHFANRNARPWKTTEDDDPSSAVNATAMDA